MSGSPRTRSALAAAMAAVLTAVALTSPAANEIPSGADWCAAANRLAAGEELVLAGGVYRGPCTLSRGGVPGSPVVIRARDVADPPRIVYSGSTSNVLNLRASHVHLSGIQFGQTAPNVDAIRVYAGNDITIEGCRFWDLGGAAIVANHSSVHAITIRRNDIERSTATAIYLGCHDGVGCVADDVVIEENYIRRVSAASGQVGYAIQLKLNSSGLIRDNTVVETKGPGIMVYGGSVVAAKPTVVEGNFVAGSRTSAAIVVGGGPAVVRNNIATGSAEGGIALEDYGRRGLLRGITIAHNTVWGNDRGGILVPDDVHVEARVVNNAVHARAGSPPLPPARVGLHLAGNVDCSVQPCFRNPAGRDFSPLPGSLLIARGRADDAPRHDFFGRLRGLVPTSGAIEPPGGVVVLGIKRAPVGE